MSAEVLRRAADLMRERAQGARAGRWSSAESSLHPDARLVLANWHEPVRVATCSGSLPEGNALNAEHIASWHPVVALRVADWLYACASAIDKRDDPLHVGGCDPGHRVPDEFAALAVARTYLGEVTQ